MSDSKEFTLQEVSAHNTKKDLYMVIHDKVYDCSSFVDEHPYVFLKFRNAGHSSPVWILSTLNQFVVCAIHPGLVTHNLIFSRFTITLNETNQSILVAVRRSS